MNEEIIENEEINRKKFDSADICINILAVGFMVLCILIGIAIYRSLDKTEEDCVSYYKENHYITEKCKKYNDNPTHGLGAARHTATACRHCCRQYSIVYRRRPQKQNLLNIDNAILTKSQDGVTLFFIHFFTQYG